MKQPGFLSLLAKQFQSPLVLVLIFGAVLSLLLNQLADALIILIIVLVSAFLGFRQEYKASTAMEALRRRLALVSRVKRDGAVRELPAELVVPGDIVVLSAGSLVPADGALLSATDFLVTEAAITGESLPVEKRPGISTADAPVSARNNCVFAGTSVRSGIAEMIVAVTGVSTYIGKIGTSLESQEAETEFARGIRKFGNMLIAVMTFMVLFVVGVSQVLHRPFVESLLFAVALAVGMTPELLPAIVNITLSKGAAALAQQGVLVRKLEALENLGGIDVLCTDKTGTLTEGDVKLHAAVDMEENASSKVLQLGFLNASFESGIENPLDRAIIIAGELAGLTTNGFAKIDEIPYDFQRKRLTIVVSEHRGKRLIITKGAFNALLSVCSKIASATGKRGSVEKLSAESVQKLHHLHDRLSEEGYRLLAVATKETIAKSDYDIRDEQAMTLQGFLLFADPPKEEARLAVHDLGGLGVRVKIVSGDNRQVSAHVAKAMGINAGRVLTGPEITSMHDDALAAMAEQTDIFAEIDPQQKENIIRALQKRGHAVGYLGDGINDAPALRAADVGISVDSAVDVARQNADIVLLSRNLDVLRTGVVRGRQTFANTLKYISITTSANFGNMISMAIATPFLPFLPLAAKQILLNNFLSDLPAMAISTDNVDEERVATAQRFDVAFIRNYMIVFGLVSSVFDLLTFALLVWVHRNTAAEFQSAWFVVSVLTEVCVIFVLRTRRSFLASFPSAQLILLGLIVALVGIALPYVGFLAPLFGFVALAKWEVSILLLIVLTYLVATEVTKHIYFRRVSSS